MNILAFIRVMDVRLFHAFSDLVKSLREQSRLSQRDFAKKLKISSGYVGQWEMGISQPEADALYRSLGYREIPPFGDYLLDPLSQFLEKRPLISHD